MRRLVLILCLFSFHSLVLAGAATPNAGTIERTLPTKEVDTLPTATEQAPVVDEFDIDNSNQTRVLIKTVTIKGNVLISSDLLQEVANRYLNKKLSLKDFDQLRLDIIALYRTKGYWATAIFDEQDITSFDVALTIYEGRVGKIILNTDDALRFSDSRAKAFIERKQTPGEPVRINVLDQSVANLDAVPGVNASLDLKQGAAAGETDIIVNAVSPPLFSGGLVTDNFGSKSTGYGRAMLNLSANSLFHQGEQINLQYLKSNKDLDFYALSANYPLLDDGTKVAYLNTNMDYRLGTPFAALDAKGDSQTQTFSLSRPFDMLDGLAMSLKLDYSLSDYLNKSLDVVSSDNEINSWVATINLGLSDNLLGGGYTSLTSSFEHGDTNLKGNAVNRAADLAAARTHGSYSKVNVNITRIQSLLPSTNLWWMVTAQHALNRNLDSSRKMSLGGAAGVRAFPASEANGDIGLVSQLELRHQLTSNLETKVFYDFGYIKQNKQLYANWNNANPTMPNSYELQGIGVGLQWQVLPNTTLLANVATKVGSNSGETSGNDNDGTSKNTRGWVSMAVAF